MNNFPLKYTFIFIFALALVKSQAQGLSFFRVQKEQHFSTEKFEATWLGQTSSLKVLVFSDYPDDQEFLKSKIPRIQMLWQRMSDFYSLNMESFSVVFDHQLPFNGFCAYQTRTIYLNPRLAQISQQIQFEQTLVHEFQHLIRAQFWPAHDQLPEKDWMAEGMARLAEYHFLARLSVGLEDIIFTGENIPALFSEEQGLGHSALLHRLFFIYLYHHLDKEQLLFKLTTSPLKNQELLENILSEWRNQHPRPERFRLTSLVLNFYLALFMNTPYFSLDHLFSLTGEDFVPGLHRSFIRPDPAGDVERNQVYHPLPYSIKVVSVSTNQGFPQLTLGQNIQAFKILKEGAYWEIYPYPQTVIVNANQENYFVLFRAN